MTVCSHPFAEVHESAPPGNIPKLGMSVKRNHSQKGRGASAFNRANSPAMGNGMKALRAKCGWTIDQAAAKMGLSYGGYMKLERGERQLKAGQIARAAAVFCATEADVTASRLQIPVIGEIVAGGLITAFDENILKLELAPAPDGATSSSVAYIVREGVVLPGMTEGSWLIYHDKMVKEVPDEWIGKLCVCNLNDGTSVARRIFYGRESGTFDLLGAGSDSMRGVRIKSVAIVTWTRQR